VTWVRLDDRRAFNAKLRGAGLAARGLDEAAICFASQQETDGVLAERDVEMLGIAHGATDWHELAEVLVTVGRWEHDKRRNEYRILGFLDYNPSREELRARRQSDNERKRRARETSARNPNGIRAESERNP
jgi:hypothetical protein